MNLITPIRLIKDFFRDKRPIIREEKERLIEEFGENSKFVILKYQKI